jgi:hypothetical protein
MKAMVEFEACATVWAQLGDAFAAQLMGTRLVERFSAAAAAVHPSYLTYRLPPPPGAQPVDLAAATGMGLGAGGPGAAQRHGETFLELSAAVEVFLEVGGSTGLGTGVWPGTKSIAEFNSGWAGVCC